MRHETADEELYEKLHPGDKLENRKAHLLELKRLGYEVGAGSMVGYGNTRNKVISNDITFDIANKIKNLKNESRVVRENRIKDITNHILLPFDEKYNAIGKFILQTAQNIVDEANREYLLHAELIDKWPQIVIKAKNINLMDII